MASMLCRMQQFYLPNATTVHYGHGLPERPEIIAISKSELPSAPQAQHRLATATGREVLLFSSVTGQGLDRLLQQAYALLHPQP